SSPFATRSCAHYIHSIRALTLCIIFFFIHAPPRTEIYTLSLHDALPILNLRWGRVHFEARAFFVGAQGFTGRVRRAVGGDNLNRSEEHTSELQSRENLVCRLLLEKKKEMMSSGTMSMTNNVSSLRRC